RFPSQAGPVRGVRLEAEPLPGVVTVGETQPVGSILPGRLRKPPPAGGVREEAHLIHEFQVAGPGMIRATQLDRAGIADELAVVVQYLQRAGSSAGHAAERRGDSQGHEPGNWRVRRFL